MIKSLNHDFSNFTNYHSHDKGGIIWFYIKSFSKSEKFRESFEGTNFKKSQILKLTARFSLIMIQAKIINLGFEGQKRGNEGLVVNLPSLGCFKDEQRLKYN